MAHEIKISNIRTDIKGLAAEQAFYYKFKNGGSEDMRVNGSVTPVEFQVEDLTPVDYFLLTRISFVVTVSDVLDMDNFAGIAELTNGILFIANQGVTGHEVSTTLFDNADLILASTSIQIDQVRISGAAQVSQLHGVWNFPLSYGEHAPIINGNNLKLIVRDDLSLVEYLKFSCHGIVLTDN